MNEQISPQGKGTQQTQSGAGINEGNQPQENTLVERAEQAVKRYEDVEKRLDEKIAKLERLQSERILGGGSQAGFTEAQKVETPAEYAKRVMSGK